MLSLARSMSRVVKAAQGAARGMVNQTRCTPAEGMVYGSKPPDSEQSSILGSKPPDCKQGAAEDFEAVSSFPGKESVHSERSPGNLEGDIDVSDDPLSKELDRLNERLVRLTDDAKTLRGRFQAINATAHIFTSVFLGPTILQDISNSIGGSPRNSRVINGWPWQSRVIKGSPRKTRSKAPLQTLFPLPGRQRYSRRPLSAQS